HRGLDPGAGVRLPRRAGAARDRGRRSDAVREAPRAGGDPPPGARGERRARDLGGEPVGGDGDRHAAAVRLEGGGNEPALPQVARRIADENGRDLAGLAGSGPGGRIVKVDVQRAIAEGPAPAAPAPAAPSASGATPGARERPETAKGTVSHEELSKLQQTVARRMAESKATAPHFYLSVDVDMSRGVEARSRIKAAAADGEPVPSFNDMVVKACAIAL